jgi:hypothetical protein
MPTQSFNQEKPLPGQLQIQTSNLSNNMAFDDSAFRPVGSFGSGVWTYPATPAHSDMGPDVQGFWESSPSPNDFDMVANASPEFAASLHRRAQTFPFVPLNQPATPQESYDLISPFSDIPSIQITSHEGSRSPSPSLHALDTTLSLPFRESMPTMAETSPRPVNRSPPLFAQEPGFNETNMDYYGDFLSPLDRPPSLSRRPSLSIPAASPGASQVSDWQSRVSSPAPSINSVERPKRRHTTCSIERTTLSPSSKMLSPELAWMLNSPRTTNYLNRYFDLLHPHYPFLDRNDFLPPTSPTAPVPPTPLSSTPLVTYTRLLTSAIGALLHHKARDMASRYVRLAMSFQMSTDSPNGREFENMLFTSIKGIHAAMLLAIYCLFEQTMERGQQINEEDGDITHPEISLWLWNARIAAGCIDLGLHKWPVAASQRGRSRMRFGVNDNSNGWEDGSMEETMDESGDEDLQLMTLYKQTFRSAFLLDRRISELKKRPYMIHEDDVDGALIEGLS